MLGVVFLVFIVAAMAAVDDGALATGQQFNDTESAPERKLDTDGLSINDSDYLMISENEDIFGQWESMARKKKSCSPSISCSLAGGYCVKSLNDCDGTTDPKGCSGGKKCRCCIPDQTTPSPSTCPTCPPVVTCPTAPTTCPNLNWAHIGSDSFVRFGQPTNWTDARAICMECGLDLYKPKDILAVSKYLDENFSSDTDGRWHWLGGRGNGTHMVWLTGEQLTMDDPWYSTYYNNVGTNDCLYFITHSEWSEQGKVLVTASCDRGRNNIHVICG